MQGTCKRSEVRGRFEKVCKVNYIGYNSALHSKSTKLQQDQEFGRSKKVKASLKIMNNWEKWKWTSKFMQHIFSFSYNLQIYAISWNDDYCPSKAPLAIVAVTPMAMHLSAKRLVHTTVTGKSDRRSSNKIVFHLLVAFSNCTLF